ncbi:junctional adhesion molecule-like isoform X1 [Cyprinus carpio]|uniref:Junctional adhesion molecule-like isoform X1 n=1 Tax=Cyprinus carpio TaxID=7962 RepID=A0A9Q9ZT12_CYPCA|nr:junctional adhesion molecule-like isoform X1 [Cyprinus carpio]
MHFLHCVLILVFIISDDSLGFDVRGPSGPLVVPLGGSAILPCYVETPLEKVKVVWKRTDSETLVHLYQDGESRPEAQHKDYHHRAHFFTDQIQHGNFSLLLENVRAEDEGVYRCKVYSQQLADKTLVEIKHVECLLVSGSDRSVSAYDGEDVTLSCSVDSHITPEHIEEHLWRKTDGDILVLLFKNNKTLPDSSDEQYRDRAELFTAEIPKGNFSLRLKSVRIEDKGVYMCHVFAGGLSANATVVLVQLGFSSWHIAVLCFCFAAGSGAVLLLCSLIYCRSKNTDTSSIILKLQVSLVFCPNICMFFAFMLWGFTEGFLHEAVTCCALCILRPVMLIWALHYLKYLQDSHKSWIRFFRITRELAVLTVIVYSVFFAYGWRISSHDTDNGRRIASGLFFGFVVLVCLFLIKGLNGAFCILLSLFQLLQLMFSFGLPSLVFFIVAFVSPLILFCIPLLTHLQARFKCLHRRWITILPIIIITILDIILVIYAHLTILEREKEYLEWICVILFLEVLKITVVFEYCVLKHVLKGIIHH